MKTFLSLFVLLIPLLSFGQRYNQLTSTNTLAATNLIAVEVFPNATNGTKSITVSNLAKALGPYITNTVAANPAYNGEVSVTNATRIGVVYGKVGDTNLLRSIQAGANVVLTNEGTNIVIASTASGSGSSLVTNANQFGASTTLTIKSSPLVTNINLYGTAQALGMIDAEGGIQMPNLTANRTLVVNSSSDITNSSVTDTELGYLSGVTSGIQAQLNQAFRSITNLGDVYLVSTNDNISNVVWTATHTTVRPLTFLLLPGTHSVVAFTNSLVAGAINITNWQADIAVVGLGPNTIVSSPTREGTIFRVNDVGNVTFQNLTIDGYRNTNITQVYGPGPGVGINFGGNCGHITLENVRFRNLQRFGSGVFHYSPDNIYTNLFTAISCTGSNLGSWFTNGFNAYDGALFVLPNNSHINGCFVEDSAKGFEIYGADLASSNAPNSRIEILNSRTRNIIDTHLFVGGYTNNSDVIIRGCRFQDEPGWVRYDGSNIVTGGTAMALNLSGIQNLTFENNRAETAYKSVFQWTSGAKNVYGGRIRNNQFFGGHTQIVIGNDGSGRGNYDFVVEGNDLVDFGGRGMQLIGVQDGIIRNNRGNNGSTNGSLAFIYLAGTGNAHASNIIVEANSHIDNIGSTTVTYGLEIAAGSTQIRAIDNRFESVATGQISDAGTNTMVYSRTQSGVGIGTNTPAATLHVHGRAYINGTNAVRALHITGGQATNSLLYIDGGTNAGVVTIGANLSLTAGTLAATGGAASTNNPAQAAGWLQVTQAISFVGSGGTLVGTNMYYSNTLARAGSLFTNVFAANVGGVTNLMFDVADGSAIELWIWPSNGVTARMPQFTASQFSGNPSAVPTIGTNAWSRIRVTRANTYTNVSIETAALDLAPGNMISIATNYASRTATLSVGNAALTNIAGLASTVFTNVPLGGTNISVRTSGGTNFIDTTGQLNNWAAFTTNVWNSRQGGSVILTNLAATSIDFPAANIVSNIGSTKFAIWTNYVNTVSNFVFDFRTNRYELKNQTNVVFTNIVEEATAVGADLTVHIHNTTGVTMGLAWPAYGAQHGYFLQTNANNAILSTTSLTSGSHGVLSLTAFGTNIFATFTTWP